MAEPLQLNASWLRNRVAELGLRQWWLAEQLGVDRRSVLRWINGQVRSIAPERARNLAEVLGCRVADLLLHDPGRQLASPDDQRSAGLALATSRLLDRLGPVGEWDVVEQLVRASAVPDLPLHVLGRLYHQLCVACWRQDKLAEAAQHNRAALDLAERCDDRALRADALGSRANLEYWRGEVDTALGTWRKALALAPWLTPRQRGALHSNVGAALYETGALDAGQAQLQQALECFEIDGTPMNRSIARGHLARLALERGDLDEAARQSARARSLARQGDYRRGQALALLTDALIAAHRGQRETACESLHQGLQAFEAQGIRESLNARLAALVWRQLGEWEAARAAIAEALELSAGFPLEREAALREQVALAAAAAAVDLPPVSPHVTRQPGAGALP